MPVTKPAFVTDADTVFAYRMNEASPSTFSSPDAGSGGYTLSYSTTPAQVRNFNNTVGQVCRSFSGSALERATRVTTAAIATALKTNAWTLEGFVKLNSVAASNYVFGYLAVGETEATNALIQIIIDTSGKLTCFWEYGAGNNVLATQVAGVGMSAGTAYHFAIRKRLAGANYWVDFFINGVLQDSIDTGTNNATGGTTSALTLGGDGTAVFNGQMRSIRLSSVARSDVEIAASAALATRMHATDASTTAHWRLDEAPELEDLGPHGVHLMLNTAAAPFTKPAAIVEDAGFSRSAASSSVNIFATSFVRPDVVPDLLGELTFRAAVYMPSTLSSAASIWAWGNNIGLETEDINFLFAFQINADRTMTVSWEHGAGDNNIFTSTYVLPVFAGQFMLHVVRREDPDNVGKLKAEIWVDGQLVDSGGNFEYPTGGTAAVPRFGLYNGSNIFPLVVDDLHIQKRALSEFEIKTDAGYFETETFLDTDPPQLTAVDPVEGATLGAADSLITFDVTDSGSGLEPNTLMVIAAYDDSDPTELVLHQGTFLIGYSGSVTEVADGLRVEVTRDAGWRKDPIFLARIKDTVGNEQLFTDFVSYVFTPGPPEGAGFEVVSATPLVPSMIESKVRIVFDEGVRHTDATARIDALNPSNYLFSGGLEVSHVTHVASDTTFDIYLTGPMVAGQAYTVKVINIESLTDLPPDPADLHDTGSFTGIVAPIVPADILIVRTVDARTLEIIFTEPVVVSDALVPGNYSISPSLTVKSVEYVSPTVYRLTTAKQTVGQSYSVTISNITDLN